MEGLGWRHRQVWRPLLARCREFFGEDGVRLRDPQLRDKLDDVPVALAGHFRHGVPRESILTGIVDGD